MIRYAHVIVIAVTWLGGAHLSHIAPPPATPAASPEASPVATGACAGLETFFTDVASLTTNSHGLAIMQEAGHDVLSLDDSQAATVVESLDILIADIEALTVPLPAIAWHTAYLDLLRWYHDMAAARDPLELQRVINNDRRLFVNLGTAVFQGQAACPGEWDRAWDAAFSE